MTRSLRLAEYLKVGCAVWLCSAMAASSGAELADSELGDIPGYLQYSDTFASAGQPSREQLSLLKEEGFDRIVYIAFASSGNAIPDEDQIVKDLGMDYLHIPVEWTRPTSNDFYAFADTMARNSDRKTLLHCQVNARASAFALLYRVLHEDVPLAEAKQDMNRIWQPNETWRQFIFDVLEENGVSADCEGCDWSVAAP